MQLLCKRFYPQVPFQSGLNASPIQPLFQRRLCRTPLQLPFQRGLHRTPMHPHFRRSCMPLQCNVHLKGVLHIPHSRGFLTQAPCNRHFRGQHAASFCHSGMVTIRVSRNFNFIITESIPVLLIQVIGFFQSVR